MRDPDGDVRVCAYDFLFRQLIPRFGHKSRERAAGNGAATISDDQLTFTIQEVIRAAYR